MVFGYALPATHASTILGRAMPGSTESLNPYAPARAPLNDGLPPGRPGRSFARRISVGLGIAGAVAAISAVVLQVLSRSSEAIGLLITGAFLVHAVGIGSAIAAPRGSRMLGCVLNGLAMAFVLALMLAELAAG